MLESLGEISGTISSMSMMQVKIQIKKLARKENNLPLLNILSPLSLEKNRTCAKLYFQGLNKRLSLLSLIKNITLKSLFLNPAIKICFRFSI
jgi:hypothetical protein